jgi:endonuclease/exonuclease/phosphatase family metal-dependent hydrolase
MVTRHAARVFLVVLIALPLSTWLRRSGRLGALLALGLLGAVGGAHADSPMAAEPAWPQTLRVAQYNVQFVTPWGFGRVSAKHWPNTAARARAIGETLACFDIVALNETINDARRGEIFAAMEQAGPACGRPSRLAGGRQFEVLAGPGPEAPSFARMADWLSDDAALAWLGDEVAIASRLPIVASAQMAYSTARGSDAIAAKGVLHARLRRAGAAPPGDQLDLFVTHLQANHADIRADQIGELVAFIRARSDPDLPAIVLGDLNIDGSAPARRDPRAEYHQMLRALAALGFRDPGQALGGTDSWQRRRIDYLLLRGQLGVADLRTEQFDDLLVRALSDHAALTAELRWRPPPRLTAGR